MEYSKALNIANKILSQLSPHCIKCEIAGSIRRKKSIPKDIEIVCIPNRNIHSNQRSKEWMTAVQNLGHIKKGLKTNNLGNAKYLQIRVDGIDLDLFIAEKGNWGLQKLIRTGPSYYSARILSYFNSKGYKCVGAYPTKKRKLVTASLGLFGGELKEPEVDDKLSFTTEQAVYDYLDIPFVQPEKRN